MQGPRTIQTAHRVIQGIEAATLYQEIGQTEGGTGLAQKKLPVGNEALRKLMEPGNTAGASSRFSTMASESPNTGTALQCSCTCEERSEE